MGEGDIKNTERSKPSTNSGMTPIELLPMISFGPFHLLQTTIALQSISKMLLFVFSRDVPSPSCVENILHFSGDDSVLVAKLMTGSQVWDINTGRTIISLNDQVQFNDLSLSHDRKLLGGLESNNMII